MASSTQNSPSHSDNPTQPTVTVVIPTRNRGTLIAETIRMLCTLDYPGLEILVVDQSTNQITYDCVVAEAKGDPRLRVESSRSVGSSVARNIGARMSGSELVAYVDDDCIVTKEWLSALVDAFQDAGVAAVYGRLLPYEQGQRTGREVGFKPTLQRETYSERTPPWHVGHGGNMAFRRKDLLEVGGFDPLLGAGCRFGSGEDGDIAYRLLVAKKRIIYAPDALAYHKHWKDWTAQRRMERAYGVGAGAQFAKYMRCGDSYGAWLLALWVWQLGVRRMGSGLLKWHSLKVMYLGYCQLIYPWLGSVRSLRYSIDEEHKVYQESVKFPTSNSPGSGRP
jgi:GT2 family glycosyltransferase